MSLELYRSVADQVAAVAARRGARDAAILWHGGEPLLMGKDFFREALAYRPAATGVELRHLMQSNLLAFDEDWAGILGSAQVALSSSVDPFDSGSRLMPDGSPQYPLWIRRFSRAGATGMRLGIVFTVTRAHSGSARELYAFFRNLSLLAPGGFGLRVNAVYPEGGASGPARGLVLSPEEHLGFFAELARAWNDDGRSLELSPFAEVARGERLPCDLSGGCWEGFVGIDGEGHVASCGRELDAGVFRGSVEAGLDSCLTEAYLAAPARRAESLRAGACSACAAWEVCHGGCPKIGEAYTGDPLGHWPYCETLRSVFAPLAAGAPR